MAHPSPADDEARERSLSVEQLSREAIDDFLDRQTIGRLGCHHAGTTYVVPLIVARHRNALYALTTEGTKTQFARANPSVCFETDDYDSASGNWTSVIIQGRYEELDAVGTAFAIAILTRRHGFRRRPRKAVTSAQRKTIAFRIAIESATGRRLCL